MQTKVHQGLFAPFKQQYRLFAPFGQQKSPVPPLLHSEALSWRGDANVATATNVRNNKSVNFLSIHIFYQKWFH